MFTVFFNMTSQPFAERITAEHIFNDERTIQGLARLSYMAQHGTIALITGQTGMGKSTLIKLFLSQLPQNHYKPVYIHFTPVRSSSLLGLISCALGETSKRGKDRQFMQIINASRKNTLTPLLIIDEAHLLEPDALTDVRLLVSSALDDTPPLKIVLCGQEDIKNLIKQSRHADLAQRICVRYHLRPFTKAQTSAYIDFHMNSAGANNHIFDTEVKDLIHEYANGTPRQINNIAIACLITASMAKSQKVTSDVLHQAIPELNL